MGSVLYILGDYQLKGREDTTTTSTKHDNDDDADDDGNIAPVMGNLRINYEHKRNAKFTKNFDKLYETRHPF